MQPQSKFGVRWPVLEQGLLNPRLDIEALALKFAERGRIRIDNALRPEVAEFLRTTLENDVPWYLAFRDGSGDRKLSQAEWDALDPAERKRIDAEFNELARTGFQFSYCSYMMITAYLNGQDPDLPLHRVVELLNRQDWIGPMAGIIGNAAVRRANCQATLYRPGDFLSVHNDFSDTEPRLAAYVINLSRGWRADLGGLLQFLDDDGEVIDTFVPRFNSISLFKTPALHCVSPAAAHASGSRAAITGWLLS